METTSKKSKPIVEETHENNISTGRLKNSERDKKMQDALGLYIRGYSLQSISEMETIRVGVKTLTAWKKSQNWDEEKSLQNISPNEIKKMIRSNIAAIKIGKQMPYKPDDISKLAAAWEKMDDNKKKAVYSMEAFDSFVDWFTDIVAKSKGAKRDKNLEILKTVRTLQDSYIETLI
ncbi:terminase gpP N-terminus-related DNA-binding protein [Flavobacterium covae]|uniref:terminase gpP N-terminus-related DNA-binding protein n=1 Tax=Flavobacterium covae TaxID=2906076 RepID=UPI000745E71B|nr:hypothetical protein [Flavobacterium covae]AMA48981.1 hypothetical protein AWN65_05640 [Flavobacterium covae]MCJ1809900.1 hypothetical protein [Flavobacterium covae]